MKYEIGEKILISYGRPPKKIRVEIIATIAGGDAVTIDRDGQFYTTWWEINADQAEKLRLNQRHWRRYSKGLYFLRRGLLQALVSTQELKVPTILELKAFCQDKQAEISVFEGKVDLPRLEAMSGQFDKLNSFLQGKVRWPLKQGREQLSFFLLFRDSKGRVNIGVLRARLSTIDRRFTAELEHLLGWLPHYAARYNAVCSLQITLQHQVSDIALGLGAMMNHPAFRLGRTDAKQITGLAAKLERNLKVVESLKDIRPFSRWAELCQADLASARQRILNGDFVYALADLEKLGNSCNLRILGFALEELISNLSFQIRLGEINKEFFGRNIDGLIEQLGQIKETGFVRPVIGPLTELLAQARYELDSRPEKFWAPIAKRLLKQAADLI